MDPAERVRQLADKGKFGADEAQRLLAAIDSKPAPSKEIWRNPFERFGGGPALILGVMVSLASMGLGALGIRFDGAIDVHITRLGPLDLKLCALDQLVDWVLPAFLFWVVARALAHDVRLIDFMGFTGAARLPLFLVGLVVAGLKSTLSLSGPQLSPGLVVISIVGILALVAHITLYFQGYRHASGLSGSKLVGSFIALLLTSEILSKVLLSLYSLLVRVFSIEPR